MDSDSMFAVLGKTSPVRGSEPSTLLFDRRRRSSVLLATPSVRPPLLKQRRLFADSELPDMMSTGPDSVMLFSDDDEQDTAKRSKPFEDIFLRHSNSGPLLRTNKPDDTGELVLAGLSSKSSSMVSLHADLAPSYAGNLFFNEGQEGPVSHSLSGLISSDWAAVAGPHRVSSAPGNFFSGPIRGGYSLCESPALSASLPPQPAPQATLPSPAPSPAPSPVPSPAPFGFSRPLRAPNPPPLASSPYRRTLAPKNSVSLRAPPPPRFTPPLGRFVSTTRPPLSAPPLGRPQPAGYKFPGPAVSGFRTVGAAAPVAPMKSVPVRRSPPLSAAPTGQRLAGVGYGGLNRMQPASQPLPTPPAPPLFKAPLPKWGSKQSTASSQNRPFRANYSQ